MISRTTKINILVVLTSTLLSLVLFIFLIETYLDLKYERWKSDFTINDELQGGIITASKNPILMWEYHPNFESTAPTLPNIQTNRYGFRDYDYESMAKPADVFRISFIGDSVTLGLKVESQNTFINKLSTYTRANNPNQKIHLMNHGISGYNTIQISELLTSKVLQFQPDKIVYVLCLNDFDFEDSSGKLIEYFSKPSSFVLKKFEKLYRLALDKEYHLWYFKKNKEIVFNEILDMKKLLHEKDIDFQIVIMPIFKFKDSDKGFTKYPITELHDAIRQFLTIEKIDFFDLLNPLVNQPKLPNYFAHDLWHPNSEGHNFIAKQLLQPLLNDI